MLLHHQMDKVELSGPVRFPVGLRLYRRYEELTQWEAVVAKHFPELKIPTERKARNCLHKQVDPALLQDPEFRARHEPFRTKIALVIELVEEAIGHKVPFGMVVFDSWYLAEDLIQVLARRRKDWISLLKTNCLLETASFHLRDANGWTLKLPGPHLAVDEKGVCCKVSSGYVMDHLVIIQRHTRSQGEPALFHAGVKEAGSSALLVKPT